MGKRILQRISSTKQIKLGEEVKQMVKIVGKVTRVAKTGNAKGIIINDDEIWRNPTAEARDLVTEDLDGCTVELEMNDPKGTHFTDLVILEGKNGEEEVEKEKTIIDVVPENKSVMSNQGPNDTKKEKVSPQPHPKETSKPTTKKRGIDYLEKGYTIKLGDNEFILHKGLLDIAHKMGLRSIETFMIGEPGELVVFKAKVRMKDGSYFEAHGDADKINVAPNVLKHKLRMAETRAVNRALRFATDIGMCSYDELSDEDKKVKK